MVRVPVREVLREEVMLVHSEGHWDRVRATGCTSLNSFTRLVVVTPRAFLADLPNCCAPLCSLAVQTIEYLETCKEFFERLSLYVNPDSAFCARLSCGGVIEMARAVAEGQIRNGFAIVRCVLLRCSLTNSREHALMRRPRPATARRVTTPSLKRRWGSASSTTLPSQPSGSEPCTAQAHRRTSTGVTSR